MGHLTNEEFFVKLTELFELRKDKDHGAIYLTQKQLTYGQEDDTPAPTSATGSYSAVADATPAKPLPIIIRATNGKGKDKRKEKLKLSTIVEPDALDAFFRRYAEVCKAGMTKLKPRDKSKKKAKAKKRKGGTGTATTPAAA